MAQEHFDRGPGECILARACGGVGIDKAAAALDDFDFSRRDARMLFDAVDVGEPDDGEQAAKRAHEPETTAPTEPWISHPKMGAKIGSAKYCAELKIAEARPRSEVGNQAATMRPLPGKTGAWKRPESNRKRRSR